MDPKLQSSFIPKTPVMPNAAGRATLSRGEKSNFFSFVAFIIFVLSIILAIGMYGYKFYLKYSISSMGTKLEQAQVTIQPEIIGELTDLNNRITSTRNLVSKHVALTPLFEFLEASTPKTVRFNYFQYSTSEGGLVLTMKGEARGYAALALAADIFSKSQYFKNPNFSNLSLNQKGDVSFSFDTTIDPSLVSYNKVVEDLEMPVTVSPSTVSTTSTSSVQRSSSQTVSTTTPQ